MTTNWNDSQWLENLTSIEQILSKGRFEKNNQDVKIIGFGEISTILQFYQQPRWVVKRMPIFDTTDQAKKYCETYLQYNQLLEQAGINIPSHKEYVVGENPVTLYLLQDAFLSEQIVNNTLINTAKEQQKEIMHLVVKEIDKVFQYNQTAESDYQLSCDGQASNWAIADGEIFYVDTSTPLFKINNIEQLEYELLLKSTPTFLRGIIRYFFIEEVMERYYQQRLVYTDLIANLEKEQLAALIPDAVEIVNSYLNRPLSVKEIRQYYRQDKLIWQMFLVFRKFDRWLHRHLWRKPYQYLLPEKVQR